MGEVAALVEAHAEDGVAQVEEAEVDGHVGLSSRVGLDVGVHATEQFEESHLGEALHLIDDLATFVVATPWVPLRVLVREHRAGGLEHRFGHEVLRSNQMDAGVLPFNIAADQVGHGRVDLFDTAWIDHWFPSEKEGE